MREGVIARLASKALIGDARAMNKFIDTMQAYDNQNASYCREAELYALHQIFAVYRIAQLNAGLSFKTQEIKLIARFLEKVDDEFKKLEPKLYAMFDKDGVARPEILEDIDDSEDAVNADSTGVDQQNGAS